MIWEEIFLYCLLFLFLLHIIGHPILKILERIDGLDSLLVNLDSIQKLPIEFVLGGTVIYVWSLAATPFHAFDLSNSWILTIAFALLYLIVTFVQPRRWITSIGNVSPYSWFAAAVFLFGLLFRVLPFSVLTLGSVNDSALHSL